MYRPPAFVENDRDTIAALSQSRDANDQAVARLMCEQMMSQKKSGTNE